MSLEPHRRRPTASSAGVPTCARGESTKQPCLCGEDDQDIAVVFAAQICCIDPAGLPHRNSGMPASQLRHRLPDCHGPAAAAAGPAEKPERAARKAGAFAAADCTASRSPIQALGYRFSWPHDVASMVQVACSASSSRLPTSSVHGFAHFMPSDRCGARHVSPPPS